MGQDVHPSVLEENTRGKRGTKKHEKRRKRIRKEITKKKKVRKEYKGPLLERQGIFYFPKGIASGYYGRKDSIELSTGQ